MEIVNLKGFNCYNSSLTNIAHNLGIEYTKTYANLWSEIDFMYNDNYRMYLSNRFIENLERLGLKIELVKCESKQQKKIFLDSLEIGEWAIIEMDCYYLPWHNFYQKIWYAHYFPILKESKDSFYCLDPLYNKLGMILKDEDIIEQGTWFERILKSNTLEKEINIEENIDFILNLQNKYK